MIFILKIIYDVCVIYICTLNINALILFNIKTYFNPVFLRKEFSGRKWMVTIRAPYTSLVGEYFKVYNICEKDKKYNNISTHSKIGSRERGVYKNYNLYLVYHKRYDTDDMH